MNELAHVQHEAYGAKIKFQHSHLAFLRFDFKNIKRFLETQTFSIHFSRLHISSFFELTTLSFSCLQVTNLIKFHLRFIFY